MTKLPRTISILGKKYKIIRKLKKNDPYYGQVHGLFNTENNTIYVDPNLDFENTWCTFLHEWKHAVDHNNGLVFTGALSGELMEMLAETNANAIWQLLNQLNCVPKS